MSGEKCKMKKSLNKVYTFIADIRPLYTEEIYKEIYKMVPDFRQEKADRLRQAEDRAQSVGAWRLWMLAQKYLEDEGIEKENLEFNLSHSGKYVLCSVGPAGEKAGCDIETIKEFREALAKRFFCPEEYEYMMAQDEEMRCETFYRYWVLKESFMKATRQGMAMGLDTFSINLDGRDGQPELVSKPNDVKEKYYYHEYKIDGARIAVCSTCNAFAKELKITKLIEKAVL